MSYPYPQDRHRDRKEQGEQPYKDARQAMSESEADIQTGAEAFGEANLRPDDAERTATLEEDVAATLRQIGDERAEAWADEASANTSP